MILNLGAAWDTNTQSGGDTNTQSGWGGGGTVQFTHDDILWCDNLIPIAKECPQLQATDTAAIILQGPYVWRANSPAPPPPPNHICLLNSDTEKKTGMCRA